MKYITTLLTISSLVVLAGCTTTSTANTNQINDSSVNNDAVNVQAENSDMEESAVNEAMPDTESVAIVDTSDWLTHTNEEYGFSFKYPAEWHIDDKTSIQIPGQYKLVLTAGKSYNPNEGDFLLTITSEGEMNYKCAEWSQKNICESVLKSIKTK